MVKDNLLITLITLSQLTMKKNQQKKSEQLLTFDYKRLLSLDSNYQMNNQNERKLQYTRACPTTVL